MRKEMKIINHKQNFIFASVILFVVLSCTLVINAILHNSQAEWAIIPDIKFVGEYKISLFSHNLQFLLRKLLFLRNVILYL